jgi:hypothetical protein
MTYIFVTLAADVIEQNSKKLYAIIIEVYSLIKKTAVTFKLKNLIFRTNNDDRFVILR